MEKEKSMSLYDITAEERRFIEALVEGEGELTPELEGAMEALKERKACKVESCHRLHAHLEAVAAAAKAEEERLARRRRVAERGMQRLRDALRYNMEALGITRLEGETVTASLRANPGRVEFDGAAVLKPYMAAIDRLCAELPSYVTVTPAVIRAELRRALEAGEPVDSSVRVERSNTVIFR